MPESTILQLAASGGLVPEPKTTNEDKFNPNQGFYEACRVISESLSPITSITRPSSDALAGDDDGADSPDTRVLGRGGSAVVKRHGVAAGDVLAEQHKEVAVKWFEFDPASPAGQRQRKRLDDEITMWRLAEACCDSVCPLLAVLTEEGGGGDGDGALARVGCVMQLYADGTLVNLLSSGDRAPLPLFERLEIAAETANAVAALHTAGPVPIILGDLKPENIMVQHNEDTGKWSVALIDFGSATLQLTETDPAATEDTDDTSTPLERNDPASIAKELRELWELETDRGPVADLAGPPGRVAPAHAGELPCTCLLSGSLSGSRGQQPRAMYMHSALCFGRSWRGDFYLSRTEQGMVPWPRRCAASCRIISARCTLCR